MVIEEGLVGPEVSLLCVCDGRRAVPLAPAQDYKRLGDGDTGPNTGGMGAYSPVPGAGNDLVDEVLERAVEPTLAALRGRGIDYRGVLYAGLMLTADGPKVLEYNVRFGDPEAQVVLPRYAGDLAAAAGRGRRRRAAQSSPRSSTTPPSPSCWPPRATPPRPAPATSSRAWTRPRALPGVERVLRRRRPRPMRRHRRRPGPGRHRHSAPTSPTPGHRAYAAVSEISWPGMQFRTDIAAPAHPITRGFPPEGNAQSSTNGRAGEGRRS